MFMGPWIGDWERLRVQMIQRPRMPADNVVPFSFSHFMVRWFIITSAKGGECPGSNPIK